MCVVTNRMNYVFEFMMLCSVEDLKWSIIIQDVICGLKYCVCNKLTPEILKSGQLHEVDTGNGS